ncbi:hypothetical protein LOD99_13491 [Oopsacas minuta]|uniref:Rho-GAP domain-containing protein n=1 Tax=Oopsacas minuta TaxID=111878 RepID=A0AAV7KKM5_9METZ|nr:hypothetical protein LOD99_13491 [Oopsacas minuta]
MMNKDIFGKGLSNLIDSVNVDLLKVSHSKSKGQSSRLTSECDNIITHFAAIDKRLEIFTKSSKALQIYLQKRVSLERENIRSLLKMAKSSLEDSQFRKIDFLGGCFDQLWSSVRQNLEQETARRIEIIDNLEKRVVLVLQKVLQGELDTSRRQLSSDGKKLVKDYTLYYQSYCKSSERYRNTAAEWEGLLLSIYTEYSGVWAPTSGVKIWEKEVNTSKRMEEHRKDYSDHLEAINSATNSLLLDQLRIIIQGMSSVAEAMAQTLMSVFKHYSEFDLALSSTSLPSTYSNRKSTATKEPVAGGPLQPLVQNPFDHKDFAFSHMLGGIDVKDIPPPIVYRFEEYILCDEATHVLSNKVRYQCLDQMSTHEQASAIQSMMSQKSPLSIGATPNKKAFNTQFVISCLEYLRGCNAIKEEGLFRVSGNASRIKYLYDMSLGDRQDELAQEVKNEVDMHTVAGAMKRHLRECSILSSTESIELSKCLDYPMSDEKKHNLKMAMRKLPSEKRDLLTTIMEFCNELVDNEPINKMNAHAIGISLGLSLFPEMDTNHSTNLLKCLLIYQTETQPQMKSQFSVDDPLDDSESQYSVDNDLVDLEPENSLPSSAASDDPFKDF